MKPLQIQYYRKERLVAVDAGTLRLSSVDEAALKGLTSHAADKAKVMDGDTVVAVFSGCPSVTERSAVNRGNDERTNAASNSEC